MYEFILLDLDGTVTDSAEGIINSVEYALKKMGEDVPDRSSLYRFIGPPLIDEFRNTYGFSEEKAQFGLKAYREYFADKGLFENRVYDGIPEVLEKLNEAGKKVVLATSKPELYSERILEHFDLRKYFYYVSGATMDEKRVHKDEVIEYALNECGINKDKALMVGDRSNDIYGARSNGLEVVGALYGYGSRKELEEAGCHIFADTPTDILKYALN